MKRAYILWADDDQEDLSLISEVLEELNLPLDVVEVNNGREALASLDQAKQKATLPCLIVLDINMPFLDGKETLTLIKGTEAYRQIPVVVFSTSNNELDKRFFRQFQVEMLSKPSNYELLKKTIQRIVSFCN
jgi:CheY-like chemotaxis protein